MRLLFAVLYNSGYHSCSDFFKMQPRHASHPGSTLHPKSATMREGKDTLQVVDVGALRATNVDALQVTIVDATGEGLNLIGKDNNGNNLKECENSITVCALDSGMSAELGLSPPRDSYLPLEGGAGRNVQAAAVPRQVSTRCAQA